MIFEDTAQFRNGSSARYAIVSMKTDLPVPMKRFCCSGLLSCSNSVLAASKPSLALKSRLLHFFISPHLQYRM
jgi:hypothetical protein